MTNTLKIRLAIATDLDQLVHLFDAYRQFYQQAPDLNLAKSFITTRFNNQESVILVAVDDDNLVGFCQIYPSFCSVIAAKIGVLYDLYVNINARKTGVAKALMLAAHDYASTNQMARLDLSTDKNNLAAQRLYESLGWVRDTVFFAYSKTI